MLKGTIRNVSDTTFSMEMNGNTITKELSEIHSENFLQLAGVIGDDERSILRKARFFLAEGDLPQAEQTVAALDNKDLTKAWSSRIARRRKVLRIPWGRRWRIEAEMGRDPCCESTPRVVSLFMHS